MALQAYQSRLFQVRTKAGEARCCRVYTRLRFNSVLLDNVQAEKEAADQVRRVIEGRSVQCEQFLR